MHGLIADNNRLDLPLSPPAVVPVFMRQQPTSSRSSDMSLSGVRVERASRTRRKS